MQMINNFIARKECSSRSASYIMNLPISIFLVWITIAVFFTTLGSLVNFSQNDDWVYRLNVEYFLQGRFELHPYLGPTYVTQGIMGALFAKLFGLGHLGVLTAVVGSLNILIFIYILRALHFKTNYLIVATLLYAFNPLNVYLNIGFMTGQYFMLFFMASMLLLERHWKTDRTKYLHLTILVAFIGLLARQVALIIPLGFLMYSVYKRNLKDTIVGTVWFASFFLFLEKLFPKTPRMIEVPLQLHHFAKLNYSYALVYGTILLLSAFLLPLLILPVSQMIYDYLLQHAYIKILSFALLTILFYIGLNYMFEPSAVSWGEFPYFENTFERTGFYPRGIHGTKYQFYGIYDLYKYWDLTAKLVTAMFLSYGIFNVKRFAKPEIFFIVGYTGMLVATETFYDRYLLPLIPLLIILVLKVVNEQKVSHSIKKLFYVMGFMFLSFLVFFSYQFSLDFISVNSYIWGKSETLANQGIPEKSIHGTNAWKLLFRNHERSYEYFFSYDSPKVNSDLRNSFVLVEKHEITYPLNFFINPAIYLYKIRSM